MIRRINCYNYNIKSNFCQGCITFIELQKMYYTILCSEFNMYDFKNQYSYLKL